MSLSTAKITCSVVLLLALTSCSHDPTTPPASARLLTISFPNLPLAENEYIQSITLEFDSGRVVSLNPMPSDWSATLHWNNTNCCSLTAEAGHFSNGLRSLRQLDRVITVLAGHPTRFEIRATTTAQSLGNETNEGSERTFDLTEKDLRLEPASQSSAIALGPAHTQ